MCTEMTKTYDDMLGLWHLLCMCKAEKPHLNEGFNWGFLCLTVSDKVQTIGT